MAMLQKADKRALSVSIGQHSRAGRKPENQDFHGAVIPEGTELGLKGVALALADGISSSSVSRIASETAVKTFLTDYYCTSDTWSVKTAGQRVITAINSWLHSQSQAQRLAENMNRGFVCTFSCLVLKGRQAHVFHVGDSRVSRLAGASMEQLTKDHRTVLSPSESYLARAVGLSAIAEVDYSSVDLRVGDIFLLTTDGVHEHVQPRDVADAIAQLEDLDAAASRIADIALDNGSEDNLTVQIVRIESLGDPDALDTLGLADALPPAPIPPRVPCDFDGYRLIRQLHASSRSHIYVAVDNETQKQVALKVPSQDLRGDPAYLRRFAMEEWIARRINSPHVLQAGPHRERDSLYVVTELVEGQTLRQWMHDNPQPDLETVREIVDQIAKGLRAFHRRDMVHQDLRPENIMIDRDGTVKIIDFGSVRVAGVIQARPEFDDGEILGTHQYSAPEYFLGYSGTKFSDQFSLGVIAYEMLTGRLPYGASVSRCRTVREMDALRYVSASQLNPKVPDWFDDALHRSLQPNPGKRYETLSEFMMDLKRPMASHRSNAFVPLAQRDPVRFWQIVSLALAVLALTLALTR